MPEKVIFVGNDLHGPAHEMAARLVRELRALPAAGDAHVLSIQSRKGSTDEEIEVVPGSPALISRLLQLASLRTRLRRTIVPGDIVHFVGNGNRPLFSLLSTLCARAEAALLVSPLGETGATRGLRASSVVRVHEQGAAEGSPVIRPWSLLPPGAVKRFQGGALLFASVPPKEAELGERGIEGLVRAMHAVRRSFPEARLVILNRYPHMDRPLRARAADAPAGSVEVRTEYVADLPALFDSVDAVLAPSERAHLPQVPMSVLDGLARGCPGIVARTLALASDIGELGAGAAIGSVEELPVALSAMVERYQEASAAALRLTRERYERNRGVAQYSALYSARRGTGRDASSCTRRQ